MKTFYTHPYSNQEWTKDPDLALILVNPDTIEKMKAALVFLRQSGADFMVFQWAAIWETYYKLEVGEDADPDAEVIFHNGQRYGQRDPEYTLDGCDLVLDKEGNVEARINLEHHNDYLKTTIDCLPENREQSKLDCIEQHIQMCSMRPKPGTPTGIAWEDGARQGYFWGANK